MTTDHTAAIPVEARSFQGTRAGIVSRVLANSFDFVIAVAAVAIACGAWAVLQFLLNPPGFTFAWATTGRTYGSHVMGLRVVNFRGRRLRWLGALLRSLCCLLFPIGLFW